MIPLSRKSPVPPAQCNLAKAVDLIGDRWTLLILRSALYGVRRFDDFQSELGTPRTILSGRLKNLVEQGLLARRTYKSEGRRARPEYVLTDKGEALRPVLIALTQWGDHWLDCDGQPPISFTDMQSRQAVHTAFVTDDGREVPSENLRIVLRR
ncbi:winged helix-turn-helix transcriptional regulator [Henriciella aquimarina]|uniref:winged helix-turn-helix transcriptional regulator n=1 Tax=Henriciella aquimarina TaxID=545261 RepID=UPI0009FFB448|nr:helix-turn-helix domain-containing protein [Henriciella aquimarina]